MSPRIASLLPSATETVFALGLGDQLVGVTHECDFPVEARSLPVLTRSLIPSGLSSAEIDAAVVASQRDQHTIYALDADLLARLEPDFVLTQSLCDVCAVPRSVVEDAVCTMPSAAHVMSLDPSSVGEMIEDLERLGAALGVSATAAKVTDSLRARLDAVRGRSDLATTRPRVFSAEWLDPIFCAGHWLPEMVSIAGGEERLGRLNTESVRVPWEAVCDYDPEAIVLTPCGFDAPGALAEVHWMTRRDGWQDLSAVRTGRVFVVDANAYFARPGPRLVDGAEILARLIHPELFDAPLPAGSAFKLVTGTLERFEPYS